MQGTVGKNTNSRDGDTPDHPAMGGVLVDVETVELLVDRACVERYWADRDGRILRRDKRHNISRQ